MCRFIKKQQHAVLNKLLISHYLFRSLSTDQLLNTVYQDMKSLHHAKQHPMKLLRSIQMLLEIGRAHV